MTVGVRHDDLRRRNRAMVLAAVRRLGQLSRTEIAAATELSNSTISAISADLIAEGTLVEAKAPEGVLARRGRPQVALGLNPARASVAVVVLTLNQLWATLVAYDGAVTREETTRLPTLTMGRDALVGAVVDAIEKLASGGQPPARIVLAVQGITDAGGTRMLWSPITPHADIAFGPLLAARFDAPVTVQNDCNMIAVALKWRWPQRYRDDFFAILLSDGIGMGLMQKGQLFTGTHSSGGEFGHMIHRPGGALCRCGRLGCVEAYAGSYAVVRAAAGGGENDAPPADIPEAEIEALADRARAVDGPERAAFMRAGEAIGYGLGSLFALFDPAPVAVVGPGALAFDMLEQPIREAIAQTAGGQHSGAISFATEPDEMPLIREGSAMTALTALDEEISAPVAAASARREVA
ncbi:MAG: ROK family protein [Rhizobiaceae bacterium]|nr:ROK family protein [Rhizobiaceae bacterium]